MGIGTFGYRLLARIDPQILESFRHQVIESILSAPESFRHQVIESILSAPHLAAKFYPYQPGQRSYVVPPSRPSSPAADVEPPIPPRDLWLAYAKTPEQYLVNGEKRANQTREILKTTGFDLHPDARILDFGCASGIMLRWFRDVAESGEAWGDIAGTPIVWCQQNLSPPFKFATTTSFPYLPFEDRYFDLIYAGSVFTHIADLAEAWLLELKRITRPGGRLFITVSDNETIKCILEEHMTPALYQPLRDFQEETHFQSSGFSMFSINRRPGAGIAGEAQVFYDRDYLQRHWGNYLRVVTTVPRVWGGKLTAVILER